ncbi:MAG: ABC transporter permease [Candidatus Woesearchaeota archaeon]|nr:ABC transporter permease [Candidatus Woesearchaeota archaeon]
MNPISRLFSHIFYEQYKNFKVIFRNFSSLLMLVLGPLLLILLIGFAFSGTGLHDIKIGVYSEDFQSLEPLLQNMTELGQVVKYPSIERCLYDLSIEKNHVCMKFSKGFMQQSLNENASSNQSSNGSSASSSIPGGEVYLYYDNTRPKLSDAMVNSINKFIGARSEEISLVSAKTILDNIQSLVFFLKSKEQDITSLKQEASGIRQSLVERKAKLVELNNTFKPKYLRIKEFQKSADSQFTKLDSSYSRMNHDYSTYYSRLSKTRSDLVGIRDILNLNSQFLVRYSNGTYDLVYGPESLAGSIDNGNGMLYRLSDFNSTMSDGRLTLTRGRETASINLSHNDYLALSIAQTISGIDLLANDSNDFFSSATSIYKDLNNTKTQFNLIVQDLDDVNSMIDSEMNNTDIYISKIDLGVSRIDNVTADLTKDLGSLEALDPGLAEQLVAPISKFFEPIMKKLDNITLLFPTLLAIVIIFIAMLFANNVALSEINSRAYFRNLIAPVSSMIYTSGIVITSFIVVIFQVFVLLAVAQFRFGIDIFSYLGPVLLVSAVLILLFIFVGMIIAYLFKSEQASILATTFLAIAFLMFSDVVVPLEAMPKLASFFAALNPMIISQAIFKKIILFHLPFSAWASEFYILAIYAAFVLCLLLIISSIKNKQRV